MARADLETALTALTSYQQDHSEPKAYREWAEQVRDQAERILFPVPDENHMPIRGDQVDMWLRGWRNGYETGSPERKIMNDIINDYQRRASLGVSIVEEIPPIITRG